MFGTREPPKFYHENGFITEAWMSSVQDWKTSYNNKNAVLQLVLTFQPSLLLHFQFTYFKHFLWSYISLLFSCNKMESYTISNSGQENISTQYFFYLFVFKIQYISVCRVMGRGIDGHGSIHYCGIFLFSPSFRSVLGPTQTPNQWVLRTLSQRAKRQEHVGAHSILWRS